MTNFSALAFVLLLSALYFKLCRPITNAADKRLTCPCSANKDLVFFHIKD